MKVKLQKGSQVPYTCSIVVNKTLYYFVIKPEDKIKNNWVFCKSNLILIALFVN